MGNIGTPGLKETRAQRVTALLYQALVVFGIWHKKPGKGITGYDTNTNMLITVKVFEPKIIIKKQVKDFPGGTMDRNWPASAGDTASIPGLGRFHLPPTN